MDIRVNRANRIILVIMVNIELSDKSVLKLFAHTNFFWGGKDLPTKIRGGGTAKPYMLQPLIKIVLLLGTIWANLLNSLEVFPTSSHSDRAI